MKKFAKKFFTTIAITFAILAGLTTSLVPALAQTNAADPCNGANASTKPGCGSPLLKLFGIDQLKGGNISSNGIATFIATVAGAFVVILASLSVIYLVFNAYKMISDNGDGKKFAEGKKGVGQSIIGLVVALLSFGVVSLIVRITGG